MSMYDNNKGGPKGLAHFVVVRGADSNHDKQNQNLLCYHYTIRQSYKSAAKLSFLYKTTKKKDAFLIVFA